MNTGALIYQPFVMASARLVSASGPTILREKHGRERKRNAVTSRRVCAASLQMTAPRDKWRRWSSSAMRSFHTKNKGVKIHFFPICLRAAAASLLIQEVLKPEKRKQAHSIVPTRSCSKICILYLHKGRYLFIVIKVCNYSSALFR